MTSYSKTEQLSSMDIIYPQFDVFFHQIILTILSFVCILFNPCMMDSFPHMEGIFHIIDFHALANAMIFLINQKKSNQLCYFVITSLIDIMPNAPLFLSITSFQYICFFFSKSWFKKTAYRSTWSCWID